MRTIKKYILVAEATVEADKDHEKIIRNDIALFHALMKSRSPTFQYVVSTKHISCAEIQE